MAYLPKLVGLPHENPIVRALMGMAASSACLAIGADPEVGSDLALRLLQVPSGSSETNETRGRYLFKLPEWREMRMRKTLAVLATVAAVGAAAVTPRPAEARGFGPGLAFGLAAGALAAGAYGAWGPYPYYGPRYYGYYGPRYYGPAYYGYGPGPYAYYGGPYYHRYWRRW
jgi:hypothetical protein